MAPLRFINSCIFFLFIQQVGLAQQYYRGMVLDSITREPIPFASVSVDGSNAGTITNENGRFLLRTSLPIVLLNIHEIRYKAKQLAARNDEMTILLSPSEYQLQETVIDANEAARLFKKAVNRLHEKDQPIIKTNAFFRLITKTDDTCSEMIENFYSGWLGKSGVRSWSLDHGRFAVSSQRDANLIPQSLDFSFILRYLDLLNKPQTTKINYLPFVTDYRYFNTMWFSISKHLGSTQNLVKIDFEPKQKYSDRIATSGSIYVNGITGEIHKLIQRFYRWNANPLIESTVKNTNIKNLIVEFEISFLPVNNQGNYMNHIRTRIQYDLERSNGQYKNRKVKTYADLLFYKYDVTQSTSVSDGEDEYDFDYDQIRHRLYIQKFWDNNPVLQETPYEESVKLDFEQQGSFGKMFNQTDDTLDMLLAGLLPWSTFHPVRLDELTINPIEMKYIDNFTLKTDNTPIAILAGELFLAWNCYNDTFYKVIFPLINTNASWVTDDGTSSVQLEYLFHRYHDILEVHRRILLAKLNAFSDSCHQTSEVNKCYNETKKACHKLTATMLGECWHHGQIDQSASFRWQKRIDTWLRETK